MAQIPFSQTLIHRLISLLSDEQIQKFTLYLKESGSLLPKKLVEIVYNHPEWDADQVTNAIYGSTQKKHNLNQLISYTFKQTDWLALNYPYYLNHNIDTINQLVNDGKIESATTLAENTVYIAQKICDYSTQTAVLKFLTQQSYLRNENRLAIDYHQQLIDAVEDETIFQRLQFVFRTKLHPMQISEVNKEEIWKEIAGFKVYYTHRSVAVSLLSQLMYVQVIHYFFPEKFLTKESLDHINMLEKDMDNHPYIVMPFLFDFKSYLYFLKLNSTLYDLQSLEGKQNFREMSKHSAKIAYWNHYLNIPEMYALTAKASSFASKYHFQLHRQDFDKTILPTDHKEIKSLVAACQELLDKNDWQKHYQIEYLHIILTHSVMTMLSSRKQIKKAVGELERLLTAYQQINISGSIDSIFVIMCTAYFAIQDFEKLEESFHRYIKLIRKKPMYEDNDIAIHLYYYIGQWLRNKRKQYVNKIELQYQRASKDPSIFGDSIKAVKHLAAYYNIPVNLKQ